MKQHRTPDPNPNFTFDLPATVTFAASLTAKGRSVREAWYEAASYRRWIARVIGPRRVGGIYRSYTGDVYEVLELDRGPRSEWPEAWQITVRTLGGQWVRRRCAAWDERDQVLVEPGEHLESAHLQDEIEHPVETAAFQRAAPGYAAALALAATPFPNLADTLTAMEAVR